MHALVIAKAQRKYLDEWETFFLTRKYRTMLPNHPNWTVQPNLRQVRMYDFSYDIKKEDGKDLAESEMKEIRVFDISFNKSVWGQLLYDLAPFNELQSRAPKPFLWMAKIARKLLKLKDPPAAVSKRAVKNPPWRDYINVEIVALAEDKWQNGVEMI